jgi:hypothetical protein
MELEGIIFSILSQIIPIHTSCHISWTFILILSSHLRLSLPGCPFPSRFPARTLYAPVLHTCHLPEPSHSSWPDHSNNVWWGVQTVKLVTVYSSQICSYVVLNTNSWNEVTSRLHCPFATILAFRHFSFVIRQGKDKVTTLQARLWPRRG